MNILKSAVGILRGKFRASGNNVLRAELDAHLVSLAIGGAISSQQPFLASRLGWIEAHAVGSFDANARVTRELHERMWNNPGVFPPTREGFDSFYRAYTAALGEVDLLGLMHCPYEDAVVRRHAPGAALCGLRDLEPYYHSSPWSRHLEGMRVLVVHPFASSIEAQFRSARRLLFLDPAVLPDFQLITVTPPQTLAGNTGGFGSWGEALARLSDDVAGVEFEAAVVGCGAYGMPLGAFIKSRLGKPCIHLGGATQLLFGIKGQRWEKMAATRALINDHWRSPTEAERPSNWRRVEDGCYW